jgi:hypothetical protein
MGGKKGKKGARKTNRKRGGGIFGSPANPKAIDWSPGFTATKSKAGKNIYDLIWSPTSPNDGTLIFNSPKDNAFVGSMASNAATALSFGYLGVGYNYELIIKDTISAETAASFKTILSSIGGSPALASFSITAANNEVVDITVTSTSGVSQQVVLTNVKPGSFGFVKQKIEINYGAGEYVTNTIVAATM